ncbi:MAG TPA: hypothetical protein VG826_23065 [Pirellulales bacterium]|nr:hypothetical protein [Pirellulales bacterium]
MYRSIVCLPALFALAIPCRAEEVGPNETLVRFHVSAAPAPDPVLKHVLLPELKDSTPGNAVHGYLVCFMEQQKFFFDKEALERREELATMPLDKLPVQELQNYGGSALKQADWAARLDKADWQILLKLKEEGIRLLIPDVQEMRLLARALKVRFRVEVAEHRFDDALRTAQTMFGMSRHLGEHITFIGNMVGMAIGVHATGPLEEMINEPGCPNLYWALTYLPSPLVRVDVGAQGERMWMEPTFRGLDDSAPWTAGQLDDVITRFEELDSLSVGTLRGWLDARVKDEGAVAAARARLAEGGIPQDRLKRFPAGQVLLLDEKRACQARHDEMIKLVHLPAWQVSALADKVTSNGPILFDLAPAFVKVRWAQARLDQRIALLRHVEALRLYAAEHGTLPAKLSEISVPLPLDPFCGQPFHYEVNGATAHLRGTPPKGEEKNPAFNLHYEVRLRK